MQFSDGPMGGAMFSLIPIIVVIGFVLVSAVSVMNVIKSIKTWSYNNSQPVLTILAKTVSKRTKVSSHSHGNHNGEFPHHHNHTYTTYYAAFEVESGDRIEFKVKDNEYGILVEGDLGKLTFQGSRYIGFKRIQRPLGK